MKTVFRNLTGTGFLLVLCLSLAAQPQSHKSEIIQNHKIVYRISGPITRTPGTPAIVFEQGLGGGAWEQLFPFLPATATVFEYSRNGIGESEADSSLQSHKAIVERLHELLQKAGVAPPYLLVGHSIGGAYIRLFAARYKQEVAGLVFIDPTDYLLSATEDETAKRNSGSNTSYRQVWLLNLREMAKDSGIPPGPRVEMNREYQLARKGYFTEYKNLDPLPDIPVTVIISYNKPEERYEEEMNKKFRLGIRRTAWWELYDRLRIQHYGDLIARNAASQLILLPGYSHGIHFQDPELAGTAISRVYKAITEKKQD